MDQIVSNLSRLEVSPSQLLLQIGNKAEFFLKSSLPLDDPVSVDLNYQDFGVVSLEPRTLSIPANNTNWQRVVVEALSAKPTFFIDANCSTNVTDCPFDLAESYLRLSIVHSLPLNVIIQIFGWIYFAAWSVSFYPQIYLNYKRKSVIGLSFDFLSLNLTGFVFYASYNCAMFWIPIVDDQYLTKHPRGLNPVQTNDVFFAIHAVFATLVTVVQCFVYEKGNQKISYAAWTLVSVDWCTAMTCLIIAASSSKVLSWLDFFNILSYIKLSITLIKYIPQAYFNYRRKSTIGWSIGNVLLDFTGGSMSLLQMFLLAYNNDDFAEIFGDFTKFGLGLISLTFDLLFMFQHYVLYRASMTYDSFTDANVNDPPADQVEVEDADA